MWNQYLTPNSLAEALQFTQQYQERARLLAGGTDLIPDFYSHRFASVEAVVDISCLPELKKIDLQSGIITIGSAVTLSEIIGSELLNTSVPILVAAAKQIAGPQIRNVATIGGNVVNASPAADMIPVLLVLDSLVSIATLSGKVRQVPLQAFLLGNRKVDLSTGEIVTGFSFSLPDPDDTPLFPQSAAAARNGNRHAEPGDSLESRTPKDCGYPSRNGGSSPNCGQGEDPSNLN